MGILPSVTYPSPNEWPQDQIKTITGISRARQAVITSVAHGFTSQFLGVTSMTFKQVVGMTQINSLTLPLVEILDADNFTVNVNSTQFFPYISDGVAIVDTGIPAIQQSGFQYFNTPWQNTFT